MEGNRFYLRLLAPMRVVTTRLPHWALVALCGCLMVPLKVYIFACKFLPLPMRS